MTTLILMRHGNTFEENDTPFQVGARTDLPLTEYGKRQAKKMVNTLRLEYPKAIFSGGLKRQVESAEIIAQDLNLVVQKNEALNEIDYGLWEGLSTEKIIEKWPKEYEEWSQSGKWQTQIFQGSFEKHWSELKKWLDFLTENFPNQLVFAVTSNGILRFFNNEKVKTGHFCKLILHVDRIEICSWNRENHE